MRRAATATAMAACAAAPPAAARRRCSAHGLATAATAAASAAAPASLPGFVHSDLAYRALLRNLRCLAGMRGGKTQFNVVVTGVGAEAVARAMSRLEPALRCEVAGDGVAADVGALWPQ